MDYPVYQGPAFLGYMDEEDCRDMLREANRPNGKRDVRVCRRGQKIRIVVAVDSKINKTTAMRDAGGAALSTTQREEVYWGSRKDHTDGPVRHVTVVKRIGRIADRGKLPADAMLTGHLAALVPWKETDRFPRGRFNPDQIRPLFASEAALRASHSQMAVSAG